MGQAIDQFSFDKLGVLEGILVINNSRKEPVFYFPRITSFSWLEAFRESSFQGGLFGTFPHKEHSCVVCCLTRHSVSGSRPGSMPSRDYS